MAEPLVGEWESPDGTDDWLLYDAIRDHAGLSIDRARAVLPIVHAWLATYSKAGVGIADAQGELELML